MASVKRVSVLLSEDQLLCSICLSVFTEPVTTPCGHNFCKACITRHWGTYDMLKCPLCNKTYRRPEICVNTVLSEMADEFKTCKRLKTSSTNQGPAEPDGVSCDVCTLTHTKLKALKSCLVCLTSYCETHLEDHLRLAGLKRHMLIDPVKDLEDYLCKKHERPLELFCKTDRMCVCHFCTCTESDHKSHQMASLEEAYEGEKAALGREEAEVQQMIQERRVKIGEVQHSVELSKKDADREMGDSERVFTTLISFIKRCQAELTNGIEEMHKTAEKQAEDLTRELQGEISQLEKRSSELRQLSQTEDHIHLLCNLTSIDTPPPTKDWTKVHVHQPPYVETVRTAVALLDQTLSKEMKRLCGDDLRRIQQYAVDVTLDPDTAFPYLILSEDGKRVSYGNENKNLPENTGRFSGRPCVLGKQNLSSGRFYYEVQFKENPSWVIGVARESINRKTFTLGPTQGSWAIGLRNGAVYRPDADGSSVVVPLPVGEHVHNVGVFVDYEQGLVSFYDVQTRVHLYSYTGCTFTEKLYPIFCISNRKENRSALIISSQILD